MKIASCRIYHSTGLYRLWRNGTKEIIYGTEMNQLDKNTFESDGGERESEEKEKKPRREE